MSNKIELLKNLCKKIEDCLHNTQNKSSICALKKLQENIRYSDPISGDEVKDEELLLIEEIGKLEILLSDSLDTDVSNHVKKINEILIKRNAKCKNSK